MSRLNSLPDTLNREQLLFGINQGAIFEDIRIRHALDSLEQLLQRVDQLCI